MVPDDGLADAVEIEKARSVRRKSVDDGIDGLGEDAAASIGPTEGLHGGGEEGARVGRYHNLWVRLLARRRRGLLPVRDGGRPFGRASARGGGHGRQQEGAVR